MFKVFGDDSFSIENKIFNAASFVVIVTCSVGFIFNGYINLTPFLHVTLAVLLFAFSTLFYFSRFKKVFNSHLFVLFALPGLSVIYFMSEGLRGPMLTLFIVGLITFIAISEVKYHSFYFLLTALNIILILALDIFFGDELVVKYPNEEAKVIDHITTYMASFIVSFIVMRYFKKNYDFEKAINSMQKKELQKLNTTKDKLFSIISHDLRGPLNNILSLGKLVENKPSGYTIEDMRRIYGEMNLALENTNRLLDNLLNWSRIQQDSIPFHPETIQLKAFVLSTVDTIQKISQNKNIDIHTNIANSVSIYCDKEMLSSVFRNLIQNALKFTFAGGKIFISANIISDNTVEVSIKDTGIGMSELMISDLFKMKAQTNRPGTEGEPSTGLGLVLCKEFIEKMNGQISVKSEESIGTNFIFTLPQSDK